MSLFKAYSKLMISSRKFGTLPDGEIVYAYDFATEAGFKATVLSYGATLQSLIFPDGIDIVLGFDTLEDYLGPHPYFGAIIGRVANRIGEAAFSIEGERFQLPKNESSNNLHSGPDGFDRINWVGDVQDDTLILRHMSPEGHQGFPGELLTELRFTFENSKLALQIQAKVDSPCPVNITYHPYFNLTDGGKSPCYDHQLQIHSNFHTPAVGGNLPNGEILETPDEACMNYSQPKYIKPNDALDTNFVIKPNTLDWTAMVKMAQLRSDTTGHKVIICSTAPCLQAYTGSHIPEISAKLGLTYGANHGVALEPQSFPDAVNQKTFPSNILMPGELYSHKINYTFRSGGARA